MQRGVQATCNAATSNTDTVPQLNQHRPRKVALLVEPTPFTHVSGYSNRFKEMLRYLQAAGDETEVLTPDDSKDRPSDFLGIPINYISGFRLFVYKAVQLTLDFRLEAYSTLKRFNPDIIHAATPGVFVIPAILYSRLLDIPLVISYHTHLPIYAERYVPIPGLQQIAVGFCEWILPLVLNQADLTLATSPQLKQQLNDIGCEHVDVWRKGIDTEVFNPKFNVSNVEMRSRLSDGNPTRPLLLYVGRLGAEKNIDMIKDVLLAIPGSRLAVVGSGPAEDDLRRHFEGTNTKFMGLMQGEDLSRAYASADAFMMPSESETLGFVVLESMASGVTPVCARAGGVPNLVTDGVNGFLFEPGNTKQMTEQVLLLLNDRKLKERMAKAGRAETERWDWRAATSVLRNLQYTRAEELFRQRQGWWQETSKSLNPLSFLESAPPPPVPSFNMTGSF